MRRMLRVWTDWFVLWVAVFTVLAWLIPNGFAWFAPYIKYGLGLIMFGMGMTLVPADFARVARHPRAVGCGIAGQFLVMPLLALALATAFRLPSELAMGFIILGACPGGTASNVIAYLAKADVALSVTMTACSTLLAVVATPLLVQALGGHYLPVDAGAMFLSVAQIVLVPVGLGLLIRYALGTRTAAVLEVFPAISVLVIVLIIAAVVATSHDALRDAVGLALFVVILHNSFGLALGYSLATACRLPVAARRTIAIEVGMQNSGLGAALAMAHFTPLTALPATLFSVVHNLTGSALANYWRRHAR